MMIKRITLAGVLVALAALSGCVVVPAQGYYGREYRGDGYRDGNRYYYRDYRREGTRSGGWYAP